MRFKTLFFLLSCLFVSNAFAAVSEYSLQLKNDGFGYPITVVYKSGDTQLAEFSKVGSESSQEKTFKFTRNARTESGTLSVLNDKNAEICQIALTVYFYHQTQKAGKLGKYTGCTATHTGGLCRISATSCNGEKAEPEQTDKLIIAIAPSAKLQATP